MADAPESGDAGERARAKAKSLLQSFEAAVHPAMRDCFVDCVAHLLQSERTAAASEAIEKAAEISHSWQRADAIKLAAGEMTAQELRTAQAVAGGIERAIRALASTPAALPVPHGRFRRTRREQLEDERAELEAYGGDDAFVRGKVRDRIATIDAELTALPVTEDEQT